MECLNPQFEGEKVQIRYQIYSKGLSVGLKEKGSFIIVCNQNEVSLSFCVSIVKGYPESCMGPIENLYDFSCLAKENWNEAFQIFYNKSFFNVFRAEEIKEKMLYRGIVASKPSNQNMEEFLIGIGKKEKISF